MYIYNYSIDEDRRDESDDYEQYFCWDEYEDALDEEIQNGN